MKKKSIIKRLVIFSSLIALLFTLSSSNKKSKNNSPIKLEKGKIMFDTFTIYIGDDEYLNGIKKNDNDVLALDERDAEDPNIKIYDSYKIVDYDTLEMVIDGLLDYEGLFPTDWNRSLASAMRECIIHKSLYDLGIQTDHTKDVDLNNADEKTYSIRK